MWEHGEALSLLDSRMAEISPTRVVADIALRAKMRAGGVRPLMRKTGLSQHTVEKMPGSFDYGAWQAALAASV